MVLDESTRRNLEISQSFNVQTATPTLLSVLDFTATPMGARMIKQWLQHPLLSIDQIQHRQLCVAELLEHKNEREELLSLLKSIFDMERLLGKIATGRANGRDVINLKN